MASQEDTIFTLMEFVFREETETTQIIQTTAVSLQA